MPVGKEAMTAEDFDEDEYRTNLVDKEGYSEETAKMMAKKKKESFSATKIEIDLGSLAKAKRRVRVKATATKKAHYREQEVGQKDGVTSKDRAIGKLMVKSDKSHEVKIGQYILDGNVGMVKTMRQAFPKTWEKYSAMVKLESVANLMKDDNDDEEFEHLSLEDRKKRQKDREKRQKDRAAHRKDRKEQHEEVEEGIPEGK